MSNDTQYPNGGGNVPGPRRRRRGELPGSDATAPAPMSTSVPAVAEDGELAMTEHQKLPLTKVWGLRVSEQHYDTARTMSSVLGTRYRLDARQTGELIIQFLVARRFDLDNFVQQQVGPGVDLDFFSRPAVVGDEPTTEESR